MAYSYQGTLSVSDSYQGTLSVSDDDSSGLFGELNYGIQSLSPTPTSDYNTLTNKPRINNVELVGNITTERLGIRNGEDGFSPVITERETELGYDLTITDVEGSNTITLKNGTNGLNGTNGQDGKSAYEIAVDNGFVGTETEWLESLKGQDGQDGIVMDAPSDGKVYGRMNANWVEVTDSGGGGIPEAPADSKAYARKDNAWVETVEATNVYTKTEANEAFLPKTTVIPTKTSELTNDSGFITSIDNILSTTSENPVQNKVITEELNKKADQTTVDSALAQKANSADVTASLAGKSDTGHTHDDRYYTESETNALLDDKVEVSVFDSHANNTTIHVTAEEKASWNGKAELSDIPTTLPANGGNADTVGNLPASNFLGSSTNFNYHFANGAGSDVISNVKGESHIFAFNFTDTPTAYGFLDVSSFDGEGFAPAPFGSVRQVWTDWSNPSERFVRIYKATSETDGTWTNWSRCNADTLDGKHADDFWKIYNHIDDSYDVNNATEPGLYRVRGGINVPTANWYDIHVTNLGGYTTQIAISDSNSMFKRCKFSNGWSEWFEFAYKVDIPTSLPANGGNADTLDGKHASDFKPYQSYAPIFTGNILDITEMGTYSCSADGCTNLPSEIASWCYVTAFDFRDAGYKRFICVALNDVAVYPNVIWLASESNKTSDGKLIWSKANDGGNAASVGTYTEAKIAALEARIAALEGGTT